MSLVDIHIQEFPTKNDYYYDELNMQLPDNDHIKSRCGEIFISSRKILIFVCTECKENFFCYEDFFAHLSEEHISTEEDLKYEDATYEEVIDENSMSAIEDELDDEIKPTAIVDLSPEEKQKKDDEDLAEGLNKELLETFERIDEYEEALEESEENRTVTFLRDLTPKFLENEKDYFSDDQVRECNEPHSNDNASENYTEKSTVKCEQCHKIFQTRRKLIMHMKRHNKERKFKCTICGFAFTEEFNLRSHMRRHNGDKPYACEHCGKRFTTRTEVNSHMRSHTGERPYVCEICGQSYVTSGSLNEHKKRHTNNRPHKCPICEKRFFDTGLLKEHVVIHTGERNHVCLICESSFTRRKALVQHMKLHSDVKQYQCSFCDKAFAQKPGLASHLKTHRNLLAMPVNRVKDEFILPDCDNLV